MRGVTETTIFRIFLGTLLCSPLAFGTVETWSVLIMEAGVFSSLILFFFPMRKQDGPGILNTPGIMPLAVLLFYLLFQTIPLPPALIEKISPATFTLYSRSVWIVEPGAWATLSLYPKGTVSEFLRISSYAGAYLLTTQFLSGSNRLRKTVHLLSLFAVALAFFSIIQHLTPNGKIYWARELTQGGAPFGPYVNRNHFAGLMGMLFPLVMVSFLLSRPSSREESFRKKITDLLERSLKNIHLILGFGAVVVALSIFLTLSRGGILSLCVSLSLLGFLLSKRIHNRKGWLLFIVTAIIIFYSVGWFGWTPIFERFRAIRSPQGEISELRLDIWKDSLGIVRDFPLTGTGAGSFVHVYPAYRTIRGEEIADHAHNDYVEFLTDSGLIGTGLFIWFVAAVLIHAYKSFLKRNDPYARHLFAGAFAGVIAFLLHGLTDFNFFIGANGLYFFLMLGLVVNAARCHSAGVQETPVISQEHLPRKIIVLSSAGLLILSILFNTGQMLSSILRSETSRISLAKASQGNLVYFTDTITRASFFDPLEPSHRYWLGRAAAGLSDMISERRNYLYAVRLCPSDAEYLQALGSALEDAGNTTAAGDLFKESVIHARTNAGVMRNYGSFLLRVGRKEDALLQFRTALALEPLKIRDYITLLVIEGLPDTEIISIIPENAESQIILAEYLDVTGNAAKALSVYEGAAALLRRDLTESSGIYWRIAQFASRKSRFEDALRIVQVASERFPKEIRFKLAVADYYEKLGHKDQAAAAYRAVLRLDPKNRTAKERIRRITGNTASDGRSSSNETAAP